jgi:hypothetical protein
MRELAQRFEIAGAAPQVNVSTDEYVRLLGYPSGKVFEGRALELANWARDWYTKNGRPWFYARQAESLEIMGDSMAIDGVSFTSRRLCRILHRAHAHNVVLVAVGAGVEAEQEASRRWSDEKPDEYFFLEVFASAVVGHLVTATGARLCEWAEYNGMAVLPHYSPGYREWDVAEQPRLLELLKRTFEVPFPSPVEVFDTGMLQPKKTLLAVFGLTRQTDQLRKLKDLLPCESCSFGPCQYRRAPYRGAPWSRGELAQARIEVLDQDAEYSTNRRALKRWAEERLRMKMNGDGSLDAVFRYEGTTCTNMGRPLAFNYLVKLGTRAEGYPILEQRCVVADGDTGHEAMCQYLQDPAGLIAAIDLEKPLSGERLNAVLAWQRKPSAAGCHCERASRDHKWGLVLETIHFALAKDEMTRDAETR